MPLTLRQTILYKYVVDIWEQPTAALPPVVNGVISDFGHFSNAPYLRSIKCYLDSTPETDEPTVVGRNKEVNIFTLDKWYFEENVNILDTMSIILLSAPTNVPDAHPLLGHWWSVQGNTRVHGYRANSQVVLSKINHVPAGAEGYYTPPYSNYVLP